MEGLFQYFLQTFSLCSWVLGCLGKVWNLRSKEKRRMKTQSETLMMMVGLAVCLSKVSLVPKNVSLLLRSLQQQNCIAALPLMCKKILLLTGKGTTGRVCTSPTSRRGKLVLIYSSSGKSTLPFFHSQFQTKFVPLTKITLSAQE